VQLGPWGSDGSDVRWAQCHFFFGTRRVSEEGAARMATEEAAPAATLPSDSSGPSSGAPGEESSTGRKRTLSDSSDREAPAPTVPEESGSAGPASRTLSRSRGPRRSAGSSKGSGRSAGRRAAARQGGGGRGRSNGGSLGPEEGFVSGPVLRHNKTIFSYGNYDQYYGQRYDRCASVDPRVEALLRHSPGIFSGKAVLDMGCNSGFVTLLVAALGASRVEGIDIDLLLVSQALKRLRHLKQEQKTTLPELSSRDVAAASSLASANRKYPISCVQCRGIIPYIAKPLKPGALSARPVAQETDQGLSSSSRSEAASSQADLGFPHNVEFRTENVLVSEVEERRGLLYDVVLCLKLTKWVHLHWGDDGLKLLLHKCYRLLRPGGLLVLEAQEWASYQSRKHLTPHTRQNRSLLRLRPQDLPEYLVREVGFESYSTVGSGASLKRPLIVFRRAKVSSTQDLAATMLQAVGAWPPAPGTSIAAQLSAAAAMGMMPPPPPPLFRRGLVAASECTMPAAMDDGQSDAPTLPAAAAVAAAVAAAQAPHSDAPTLPVGAASPKHDGRGSPPTEFHGMDSPGPAGEPLWRLGVQPQLATDQADEAEEAPDAKRQRTSP